MAITDATEATDVLGEFDHWLAQNRRSDWRDYDRHIPLGERAAASRAWEREMGRAGWLGLTWPRQYGGRGLSIEVAMEIHRRLTLAGAPELVNTVGLDLVGPAIIAYGTDQQRTRFLPALLEGEFWCQGFSEPDAGSDLAAMRTRAIAQDDRWVINGQKTWSSYADQAHYCILLARTDPTVPKHRGISCFLVPMNHPGLEVRPIRDMTDDYDFCELFFTDCRLGPENLLGRPGQGWDIAMTVLGNERAATFTLLATVERDLADTIALIGNADDGLKAALQERAVQCYVEAKSIEWSYELSTALASVGEGRERLNVTLKVGWSELHQRIAQLAMDAVGPAGLVERDENGAIERGRWLFTYLHTCAETIYAGSSEIQRNIIAERVLGLPRS